MAAVQQNLSKMISAQLRNKATEFLNSRKHANNVADILQMFDAESDNYTSLLLTIEVIFTELLKRGDLVQEIIPLKPIDHSPEAEYTRWLRECYEAALARCLECVRRGRLSSRLQALVTACKLLQAEGRYPLEPTNGFYFPSVRLKNIFIVLLDSEISMSALIARFQEFTEYKDVQQYGLKVLSSIGYKKSPSSIYMQNYLELLDKLLAVEIPTEAKIKAKERDDEKEDKVLCAVEGKPKFAYHPMVCRRHANRCWGFACQWSLCGSPRAHRRALLLLVERLMPLLAKPHLATDMLCDSLDAGGPISMLALQGVLELVRRHNISYPDLYDRLYAMFEPEMFATRYKRRLLHLADIFLSSTHLPEGLVAAFAKRVSRLALVAAPEDALALLQLLANLLLRHPALKRMICCDDTPTPPLMSGDPYVMEETSAMSSRALGSSLWEVSALRRHAAPALARAAADVLAAADQRAPPTILAPPDAQMFDAELKKRFKTIEMNFIRPQGMALPAADRLQHYWQLTA
ncbi:nucleolar complex protein 4 homolog B [Papilio machaon]|uniref:nucleolar complex protein 4 homolog B n=1 Tax=Papilio machaon TaxID=76193 RepID=UPI001E663477|nr:nucleolar complex protein 4 homolog B [Papilio machaon]